MTGCWIRLAPILLVVTALAIPAEGAGTVPDSPGKHQASLSWAGHLRTFLVFVPSSYTNATPAPLVVVFHGSGQTIGKFSQKRRELVERADRAGIVLVFPQGLDLVSGKPHWNEEDPPGVTVDDPGFVEALLDTLKNDLSVDEERIYAAGFSNGGTFTQYLAATRPDWFSAVAVVGSNVRTPAAAAGRPRSPTPRPIAPLPIMLIHGMKDGAQPYYGGINNKGRLMASAAETAAFWVAANRCSANPQTRGDVWKQAQHWLGCQAGSEVVWISVAQMPHNWPDRKDGYHFDGNRAILDFFFRHTR